MTKRVEIVYYDVGEAKIGPVRLTVLRVSKREEISADVPLKGDEEFIEWNTLDKIYERLARIVEDARRRGKALVIEARVDLGERRIHYGESTLTGAKVQLAPRPARLLAVLVGKPKGEREGAVEYLTIRYEAPKDLYVYEGRVVVEDRNVDLVVVETELGPRVLRRGEFETI